MAGDRQPVADRRDALVVVGLGRVALLAGGPRGERARGEDDVVVVAVEGAEVAAVLLVADLVGEVLVQRAAERDVEQLHPAADAEHRHVALDRAAGQRELDLVALGDGAARRGWGSAPYIDGSMSAAAGEDRTRRAGRAPRRVLDQRRVRRDHQRQPAGALDLLDVLEREQRGAPVPGAPLGALERGADPDRRSRNRSYGF